MTMAFILFVYKLSDLNNTKYNFNYRTYNKLKKSKMDKMTFLCLLYTTLLIIPGPILGLALAKTKVEDEKRQAQVLLPLASYAGLSVTGPLFLALVAAYGVYAVVKYGIKSDHDSHSCANNRGWCRAICFDHEVVDHYHSDICGAYKCCR